MFITFIKYIPQASRNHHRRSTAGWNVWNVLLDLSGGTFSLLQLVGDCWATGDWEGLTGDAVKLVLALVSIAFDFLFLLQRESTEATETGGIRRERGKQEGAGVTME